MAYGYRQRYGYGGQDPGDLADMYGSNPAYNPYSPNPDIGGAIRGIIMSIAARKQMKEKRTKEEEKQRYERDIEQQKIDLERRRVGAEESQIQERIKAKQDAELEKKNKMQNRLNIAKGMVESDQWTMAEAAYYVSEGEESISAKLKREKEKGEKPDISPGELEKEYRTRKGEIIKRYAMERFKTNEGYKATSLEGESSPRLLAQQKSALKQLDSLMQEELDELDREYGKGKSKTSPTTAMKKPDKYGFTIDEIKVSPKYKKPYRYIGNNQWEPVK